MSMALHGSVFSDKTYLAMALIYMFAIQCHSMLYIGFRLQLHSIEVKRHPSGWAGERNGQCTAVALISCVCPS